MLKAPDNSVFLKVERDRESGITVTRLSQLEKQIKQLLPNTILTSPIFGFDFLKAYSDEEFDNLSIEDRYEDIEKNKQIDEKLKSLDPNLFPDNLF